jgi:hypothetical protein
VVGTGRRSVVGFATPEPTSEQRITAFGVLKLQLDASNYSFQFVDETGTVRDSGTGSCHGRPA